MSADPRDDDPTHALDDFVLRMRAATAPRPPAAMPDLSALNRTAHAAPDPRKGAGGRPERGRSWRSDDVVDVPERAPRSAPAADWPENAKRPAIDLPRVDLVAETAQAAALPPIDWPARPTPPAPLPGQALDEVVRQASDFAASQWQTDADATAEPAWQPDPKRLQLRPAGDPRLLAKWRPGAWIAARRPVLASRTEFVNGPEGPAVETYPSHWLLLLWPPPSADRPLPDRWPQRVRLSALTRGGAERSLLADIPDTDSLFLADASDGIDWALAAEIALHHEPSLRPFQIDGLREFIAAEREAGFGRVNDGFTRDGADGAIVRR